MRISLKNIFARKAPQLPPGITTSNFTGKRTASYLKELGCNPLADKPMSMRADRNKDGSWKVTATYVVPIEPFEWLTLEDKRIEKSIAEKADARKMLELLAGFEENARRTTLGPETKMPDFSATKKFADAYFGLTHIIKVMQNPHHLRTARPALFTASRIHKIRKRP